MQTWPSSVGQFFDLFKAPAAYSGYLNWHWTKEPPNTGMDHLKQLAESVASVRNPIYLSGIISLKESLVLGK
jgi:hypothetical protein